MIVREMTRSECVDLLSSVRLGRLACTTVAGRPYVVPIHYAVSGNHIYSFSLPGQKIDGMRENPLVCLQADKIEDAGWRSIVVNGKYEELPDRVGHKVQRDRAWSLLSKYANWWEPGSLKPVGQQQSSSERHLFYRILIEEITGRQGVPE